MRYFLRLSYDGTDFQGWQRQINTRNSIQELVEESISRILKEKITVTACGRTDAGVHARVFYIHFNYHAALESRFIKLLNYNLPDSIVAMRIHAVHDKAHARFDASSRSYKYYLHYTKNPFLARFSTNMEIESPDLDKIRQGLHFFKTMTNFRYVCRTPDRMNTTICDLREAEVFTWMHGRGLIFHFTADRFLKSMVRIMTSRLLDLGIGKISFQQFSDINSGNIEVPNLSMAPPQGLHLWEINYPYIDEKDIELEINLDLYP